MNYWLEIFRTVRRSSNSEGVGADRTPSGVRYRSERASPSGKAPRARSGESVGVDATIRDILKISNNYPCRRCSQHFKNYLELHNPRTKKELLKVISKYRHTVSR